MTSLDLPVRMKFAGQLAGRMLPALLVAGLFTGACARSSLEDLGLNAQGNDPNDDPNDDPVAACGDGKIDFDETCDGSDLGGATCESLGLGEGQLVCDPSSCTLDTQPCARPAPVCGDGVIDPWEDCDGSNVGGATCASLGLGDGPVFCEPNICLFDTFACEQPFGWCGDGFLDWNTEECDGFDVGGMTCEALGLVGGPARCRPDTCMLDFDHCRDERFFCGNEFVEPGEDCDGENLAGGSCESLGFGGGQLRCRECRYTTDLCTRCGDGRVDPGEECEAEWLGGQTCYSLGYASGVLACGASCMYDETGCAWCGNGIVEPGETCEGNNFQGASCGSLGLGTGSLSCSPNLCTLVTTGCTAGPQCGNSVVEAGEDCDGGNLAGLTCRDLGFKGGTLGCNARTCRNDVSACESDSTGDCIDECSETQCGAARQACDEMPGCHEVLDCLDNCHDNPSFGCASDCAGDLTAAAVAVILSDCLGDCALTCSGR